MLALPLLWETPGRTDAPGPALGAHTDEVLEQVLGLKAEERAALRRGVRPKASAGRVSGRCPT